MLGNASATLLYSPTPVKRRSVGAQAPPSRTKSDTLDGQVAKGVRKAMKHNNKQQTEDFPEDGSWGNCSSNDDVSSKGESLTSKLESTVATTAMEESDSEYDGSFFGDDLGELSKHSKTAESVTTTKSDKSKKKKKKKKKDKSSSSRDLTKEKTEKKDKKKKDKEKGSSSGETPKKKKKDKKPKSKKEFRDASEKSPRTIRAIDKDTRCSLFDALQEASAMALNDSGSDDDSFFGDAFYGSDYVVPLRQHPEEDGEDQAQPDDDKDLPFHPPLWGDSDEPLWNSDEEKSEWVEETVCEESQADQFTYYTIQSQDKDDFGWAEEDFGDFSERAGHSLAKVPETEATRRVRFSENEMVHNTLHICDFTKKEIKKTWYQQKDYEDTIQGVRVVANSETPRDTQTRNRKNRSSLSKSVDTRGLEAWTPSGVQRFRYVKEAAFRAVWDEQQKQLEEVSEHNGDNSVDLNANLETMRKAYQRVSQKSQKEAQQRAKRDADIAAKLQPKRSGLKLRHSARNLMGSLNLSDHGSSASRACDSTLSSHTTLPRSCLRKVLGEGDPLADNNDCGDSVATEPHHKRVWFGEGSSRGLVRTRSDRSLPVGNTNTKKEKKQSSTRGLFRQASDRSFFKPKSDRSLKKQNSDRGLFVKPKKQTNAPSLGAKLSSGRGRGLFRQNSNSSLPATLSKQRPERGLARQMSDRGLFRSKSNDLPQVLEESSGEMGGLAGFLSQQQQQAQPRVEKQKKGRWLMRQKSLPLM